MKNVTDVIRQTVVEVNDLKYSWSEGENTLLEIDKFKVYHGEFLFIAGPSGSGKSTLLGLLTGILQPSSGEIIILNQNMSKMKSSIKDQFRADYIGYVFQMFNLIPYLNIVENVLLPCRFSPLRFQKIKDGGNSLVQEALRLLKHLKLDDQVVLEKPVVELSVGQQQRVAVARALIGSPQIIVADEPTSALDSAHRKIFLDLLFKECRNSAATLIFVSHDMGLADSFDRVIELKDINKSVTTQGVCDV